MSVYRTTKRDPRSGAWRAAGSWIVKRKIGGLSVRRSTGIDTEDRARDLERALVKLGQHGRRDLVIAFRDGEISGAELLAGVDRYGVSFQLTAATAVRLRRAAYEWLRSAPLADKTRREYRYALGAVVGKLPPLDAPLSENDARGLERGPVVSDLPTLLARYARRAKPVMFVQSRAAWQSFVRDTSPKGRHGELWAAVAAVRGPKRPPRAVLGGLSPENARLVAERLGRLGPMWWTMVCTGMGRREYFELPWRVADDRLFVAGVQKGGMTRPRDRVVFRATTPVRPLVAERAFSKALAAAGRELGISGLTVYVARRTFAHILELARIDDSRCDAYMGHSPKGMRGLYREHEVGPHLAADAAAFREVVGPEPTYMRITA